MRHFFGSDSGSMSMSFPTSMSMTMSFSMSQSMSMSNWMSMSMEKVAPISPHIRYVPSFPSEVSDTKHPTYISYEPSSVRLDSSEVTEVSSVLLSSISPSVTVTTVAS
jgi:hypothetical protein